MSRWMSLAALLLLPACTGDSSLAIVAEREGGGEPGSGELPAACALPGPSPGASPLRRLSRLEYDRTVRDLLGDASAPSRAFPSDNAGLGFDNDAEAMNVTGLLAEKYLEAAEALAQRASPQALVPCDVSADGEAGCARRFTSVLAVRAFRRPLADGELTRLLDVYAALKTQGADHVGALRGVLTALLISPRFLYRVELGAPAQDLGPQRATGYERASRLSYFLWSSMPDDALLAAAGAGELDTPDGVATQARRLLADPRAKDAVGHFHEQWLLLGRLDSASKDPAVFPDFEALRPSMKAETAAFLDRAFWRPGAKLGELFTSTESFADGPLAAFYGLPAPAGSALAPVSLAGTPRVGLLTQASLMAALGTATESSPIHRGKFVREQLLCQQMPFSSSVGRQAGVGVPSMGTVRRCKSSGKQVVATQATRKVCRPRGRD